MPQRNDRRTIGMAVGRNLFLDKATPHGIKGVLERVPADKLAEAFQRHGLGHATPKDVADVLSGKDRAGWSQRDIRKAVEALKSVGIGPQKSAFHIVTESVKNAAELATQRASSEGPKLLSDAARQENLKHAREERALEAEAERRQREGLEPMSIMERARSGAKDPQGQTIREMRDNLRRNLGIRTPPPSS